MFYIFRIYVPLEKWLKQPLKSSSSGPANSKSGISSTISSSVPPSDQLSDLSNKYADAIVAPTSSIVDPKSELSHGFSRLTELVDQEKGSDL